MNKLKIGNFVKRKRWKCTGMVLDFFIDIIFWNEMKKD